MRIARRGDFQRAFREGSRARGTYFTIVAAPNPQGETRLGLSIGRRVFRGAVDRNRLRRLMREAFRLEYRALPAGFDLIAVGSEPAARPDLDAARRELRHLAERAARRALERPRKGSHDRAPASGERRT
jgi:ribonuclease P protein component